MCCRLNQQIWYGVRLLELVPQRFVMDPARRSRVRRWQPSRCSSVRPILGVFLFAMKLNRSTLVVLALLILGTFLFLRNRGGEVTATLARSEQANLELRKQVQDLNRRVVEAERRADAASRSTPGNAQSEALPTTQTPVPTPEPEAVPGVSTVAPTGWYKNGSNTQGYVVGVDQTQAYNGLPSAYVRSTNAGTTGFGGMMQTATAETYVGKRVRYSAWVRAADVGEGGGHLWLRIDGKQAGQMLGFDNMNGRALEGTTGWRYESVVLDVPDDARGLAYGFFVAGDGQMWVNNARIEEVGSEVPTTNLLDKPPQQPEPRNLNFSE